MAGVSRWSHEELNFQIFVYLVFFFFFFFGPGTIYPTGTLGLLGQCRLDESLRDIMYMPAVRTSYGPMIHNLHASFPFQPQSAQST